MTARISVVIPTVGRASLARALESARGADEILVAWDTTVSQGSMPSHIDGATLIPVRGGDHGYTGRTEAARAATGTHLAFLDDDDVYTPGAVDLMRTMACDHPVIFQMDHNAHGILWREPVLEFGNVGTPMFLVPNVPDKLGTWAAHLPGLPEPGGDFTFIAGCVEKMGAPVWVDQVTAVVRPDRGPTITVVTPWWNHHELAPDYLAAISQLNVTDRLLVIDNGSDTPVGFPGIRLQENRGFSGASNIGLHAADTDAVLFLNNDISPTGRWLEPIRAALEPGVLVGSRIRYDAHGSVDGTPLPYLDGWCLAGMRDDLLELGGFDETYAEPSYYSDNDLCLRARAAGMRLRQVDVALHHKESATARDDEAGMTSASLANRERFLARARDLLAVPA